MYEHDRKTCSLCAGLTGDQRLMSDAILLERAAGALKRNGVPRLTERLALIAREWRMQAERGQH